MKITREQYHYFKKAFVDGVLSPSEELITAIENMKDNLCVLEKSTHIRASLHDSEPIEELDKGISGLDRYEQLGKWMTREEVEELIEYSHNYLDSCYNMCCFQTPKEKLDTIFGEKE